MNQKNICRRNLINATIVCLVGPFLAGSPLNRLLSWILEITVQVQIPECFMFGLMLAIYFATVVPIALLFLLFAYMSMSLNDLPSKSRRVISALFHFAPITYFIMLPCMMIVGVIKDQAPIQILSWGIFPWEIQITFSTKVKGSLMVNQLITQ